LLVKRGDPTVKSWLPSHADHHRTLELVIRELSRAGARTLLLRRAHAAFDTSDAELVIAVGGDGTLLAASHNVDDVPILGVNSAPSYSIGFFCGATRKDFRQRLQQALSGKLRKVTLSRMAVSINGRMRSKRVLNDTLYCHDSPAATSRYILRVGKRNEEQRSSGVWIGPPAGSTAAQRSAGGRVLPLASRQLQLVVREPYTPLGKKNALERAIVKPGERVIITSKMDDSSLFIDGSQRKITVRLGDELEFSLSDTPLHVLGLRGR
ncbi:MAG TPA: NAD(+)/NADH kinase, partial [Polyangiaceae bacterium]|nr:NAD(+)/NADH kinase [Polyangiaceae bacterium]